MSPLSVFGTPDLYCKKRWRQVQLISNEYLEQMAQRIPGNLTRNAKAVASQKKL